MPKDVNRSGPLGGKGGEADPSPGGRRADARESIDDDAERTLGSDRSGRATAGRLPGSSATPQPAATAGGAPASRFVDAPAVGAVVGDCLILDKLGEGGMGVVYRALRRMLKRVVALKVLPPSVRRAAPESVDRFMVEAQSAACLSHPHIVTVYNVGIDGETSYIEMEFVKGRSLSEVVREGPLSEPEATRIALAAAEALQYAHGEGIVHRDIKPANIMLSHEGVVKIADFGWAGRVRSGLGPGRGSGAAMSAGDARLTRTGTVMGTLAYMPPEQYAGEALDGRADIYALGITLYACLTGRPPFLGKNAVESIERRFREPLPDIRESHQVSDRLWRVIRRAAAAPLAERYADCAALISDLRGGSAGSTAAPADQAFWNSFSRMLRGMDASEG